MFLFCNWTGWPILNVIFEVFSKFKVFDSMHCLQLSQFLLPRNYWILQFYCAFNLSSANGGGAWWKCVRFVPPCAKLPENKQALWEKRETNLDKKTKLIEERKNFLFSVFVLNPNYTWRVWELLDPSLLPG